MNEGFEAWQDMAAMLRGQSAALGSSCGESIISNMDLGSNMTQQNNLSSKGYEKHGGGGERSQNFGYFRGVPQNQDCSILGVCTAVPLF